MIQKAKHRQLDTTALPLLQNSAISPFIIEEMEST
jgi:hypothetical protein